MSEPDAAEHALREPHAVEDDWHRPWIGAALIGAVAVAFAIGVINLPRESDALPDIARQAMEIALPKWGTTEVVSEIVYGSRGWDTFGETFLLLAAVIAVTTLGRAREPRGEYVGESSAGMEEQSEIDPKEGGDASESSARDAEEAEGSSEEPLPDPDSVPLGEYAPERAEAMSVVVRVAARSAAVILAVAAVYLAAWGYTPGGGFPAGAAVAGVAILLYTALGRHAVQRVIRPSILEPVEIAGAIAIIVIGLLGLAFHDSMFANWATLAEQQTIRAGGNQQLYSGAELVEVATGLTIAIFTLLGMRHDWTPDEGDDGSEDDGSDGGGSDGGGGGDEA